MGQFYEKEVKMPTCKNCGNKWNWKQTIRKTTTFNLAMTCPYCEKKQFQTLRSKVKIAMLNMTISLPLIIQAFFDVPKAILISLIPALSILIILIYPFLVELRNRGSYIEE